MANNGGNNKPAVLIIGGLGYIGRFLALHLHNENLASQVRLVDKQLPELARLSPEFKEACSRDKFIQADASREQSFPKIFDRENGAQFDYVFNCGGETRYSQDDEVYRVRSYNLSVSLGHEVARRRIPVYIECSTGQVYKPDPTPRKETDRIKPWSKQAKWKLTAAHELCKMEDLNTCVLRLPNVYGPYTSGFLATALCMARVYKHLGKEMKWLWDADLMTNTAHVEDVARALFTAAKWYSETGQAEKWKKGTYPVFNVVDHGKTCVILYTDLVVATIAQGTMARLIQNYFQIPTGFQGTLISTFARLHLDSVVDDVNDETLDPWAELQAAAKIQPGPISPFMEAELLKDTDLSMDGSAFEKETGFTYQREALGEKELEEVVDSFKRMGWWP